MNPTSVRGIRRMISRKTSKGKPVPQWMYDALDEALKKNPDSNRPIEAVAQQLDKMITQKKRHPGYRVLHGTAHFGKANKGRVLTGEELEARKLQIAGDKDES